MKRPGIEDRESRAENGSADSSELGGSPDVPPKRPWLRTAIFEIMDYPWSWGTVVFVIFAILKAFGPNH
jgi:hypothetical protein